MTQTDAPDFDDLWTLARDLFASGRAGEAICRDLSIPPSTFWKRAARDGWLRRDRSPMSVSAKSVDMSGPVDDVATALDKAWRRVCAALDAGCAIEAARWGRVHAQMKASAIADGRAVEADRRLLSRQQSGQILASTAAVARAARDELALVRAIYPTPRRSGVEKVENNSPDSPTVESARLPNRAERRRQRRDGGP